MSDQSQGPGWWIGSDGKWYPPPDGALVPSQLVSTAQPAAQPHAGACSVCGVKGQLRARQEELTQKVRPKFGVFYVLLSLTIIGFPIAIIIWLMDPRRKITISVDRWMECGACRSWV